MLKRTIHTAPVTARRPAPPPSRRSLERPAHATRAGATLTSRVAVHHPKAHPISPHAPHRATRACVRAHRHADCHTQHRPRPRSRVVGRPRPPRWRSVPSNPPTPPYSSAARGPVARRVGRSPQGCLPGHRASRARRPCDARGMPTAAAHRRVRLSIISRREAFSSARPHRPHPTDAPSPSPGCCAAARIHSAAPADSSSSKRPHESPLRPPAPPRRRTTRGLGPKRGPVVSRGTARCHSAEGGRPRQRNRKERRPQRPAGCGRP